MAGKIKNRRFGDRRDGRRVKVTGMQSVMSALFPKRTESEVHIYQTLDVTKVLEYIDKKNAEAGRDAKDEERLKIFHCILMILAKMVNERPLINRFVQGYRTYERDEISLSFVAKRRFGDHAEEALMVLVAEPKFTVDDIRSHIVGDVNEMRKSETAEDGLDHILDVVAKLPRPLFAGFVRTIRFLDFWGKVPKVLTDGDINYTTILVTNLGSIELPAIYHHLNNYGTNSVMVSIGAIHKAEIITDEGEKVIRDVIELGATVDERIADGFYFGRSLKLIKHMFEHPELLDEPLSTSSGYDYK